MKYNEVYGGNYERFQLHNYDGSYFAYHTSLHLHKYGPYLYIFIQRDGSILTHMQMQ